MIRRILVPLDGSALAEIVLPPARELAALLGASVTLLRAIEPTASTLDLAAAAPDERDAIITVDPLVAEARARDYLAAVARPFERDGVLTGALVVVGQPAEQIIRAADEADLVAMSTHGRSGIGRWACGSVADKVLRAAPTPVLLVRADQVEVVATGRPRRILVPLDGSALAEWALPLATELARRAGATLVVLRSVAWPVDIGATFAYLDPIRGAARIERDEERARADLAEIDRRLAGEGVAVATRLRSEPAADAILAGAAEERADLIVMSTHGRGGLGRWALGSVADRVLHGAAVPVLLIRAGARPDEAMTAPAASAVGR